MIGIRQVFFHGGLGKTVGKQRAIRQSQGIERAHVGLLGYDGWDRKLQARFKVKLMNRTFLEHSVEYAVYRKTLLTFKLTSCVESSHIPEPETAMITRIAKWIYFWTMLASFGQTAAAATPDGGKPPGSKGKVLVVMTNHSSYPTRSDRTGLWLTELTHFYEVFRDAGIEMDFVSPQGGAVPLDERSLGRLYMDEGARMLLKDAQFNARLADTLVPSSVNAADYMAIFYTGGHGTMWDFRGNAGLNTIAEQIYRNGGVVASVCHGAAGLLELVGNDGRPLIAGKEITGFSNAEEYLSGVQSQVPFSLQNELTSRGALYRKGLIPFSAYVVTDGRLVTGQNPGSSSAVAKEILKAVARVTER
jgi:putative intracellular protease/amidase